MDAFLPRYDRGDLLLHPDNPISVAPQANEDWLMEIRRQTAAAMDRSTGVIREAYKDFERIFGRGYGNPFFEEYMTEDADVVLVGMGTLSTPVQGGHPQNAQGREEGRVRAHSLVPAVCGRGIGASPVALQGRGRHRSRFLAGLAVFTAACWPPRFARPCIPAPNGRQLVGLYLRSGRARGHRSGC